MGIFTSSPKNPTVVSIFPLIVSKVILPPLAPAPLKLSIKPVLISPVALRVILPPSPVWELETNSPILASIAPSAKIEILPPLPLPPANDSTVPILILPLTLIVTSPPLPSPSDSEKIVSIIISSVLVISTLPPSPVLEEEANSPPVVSMLPV